MVDPLRRLANTVGRDSKLSTRGTLVDGELRSAQGPGSAPPVWFVFTGDCAAIAHMCDATLAVDSCGVSSYHYTVWNTFGRLLYVLLQTIYFLKRDTRM